MVDCLWDLLDPTGSSPGFQDRLKPRLEGSRSHQWDKENPMLSFFGTELSRRVRSHSQTSLQASLGMGPDEPEQLCTEEMTAWDSLSHP